MALIEQTKATLTKKYGPLPGWAWVAILAGGTYLFLRARGGAAGEDTGEGATGPGPTEGEITPGGEVTQQPVRNVYYGIRRCPRGYHKVGHRCVRNRRHKRPGPGARRRRISVATPAHRAASGVMVRHPAYVKRGVHRAG
jgi:hypothetical protein